MDTEHPRLDKSDKGSTPPQDGPSSLRGISWGLEFGLTIIVFVGIGYFVDWKLGTSPWILVLSLFVGFGGALYSLILKSNAEDAPTQRKARKDNTQP